MLSVHIAAMPPHNIQLRMIEHLAQILKLVFRLFRRLVPVLLVQHALERFKIRAVFDEPRHVDLRADEVSDVAPGVEEGRHHQEVHEGGAVAAAVAC
jgi:hypothetical protein